MNEFKLRSWLMQRLQQEVECEKFALMHMADFGVELVCAWPVEPNDNLDAEVLRIADAVRTSANDNLEAYEGQQRYQVRALDVKGDELATHTFKLDGGEEATMVRHGDGGLFDAGEEPPTERGLLAQLMRHLERKEHTINNMLGITVDGLMSENRSLRASQDKNDERRIQIHEKLEDLSSMQHEREEDAADREAQRAMKSKALEQALAHAPALFNHLLKGKGPVAQAAATTQQVAEQQQLAQEGAAVNGYTVEQCQVWLRDVVKTVGGITRIKDDYDEEHHETINALLGVGEDPEDVPAFRALFDEFMQSLPTSLQGDLANNLSATQKENLSRIIGAV